MTYPGQRDNEAILAQLQATQQHIKEAIANLNELDAPGELMMSYCMFKQMLDKDSKSLTSRRPPQASEFLEALMTLRRDQ